MLLRIAGEPTFQKGQISADDGVPLIDPLRDPGGSRAGFYIFDLEESSERIR